MFDMMDEMCADAHRLLIENKCKCDERLNVLAAYLATIIEISTSCALLLRFGHYSSASILCRSILEAYVDFSNVVSESGYINLIHYKDCSQLRKFYEMDDAKSYFIKLYKTKNDFLAHKSRIKSLEESYREKSKSFKRGVRSALERVGMDGYYFVYMKLCMSSHNNMSVLLDRHKNHGDSGDWIHMFRNQPDELLIYAEMSMALMVVSLMQYIDEAGLTAEEGRYLIEKLDGFRERWIEF